MEKRKNLCAMIPETLHTKIRDEQERKELTLSQFVENVFEEYFKMEGKVMDGKTRTLAFQISEELFGRIKEHLKKTGLSQKEFVISLIEQALEETEEAEGTEEVEGTEEAEGTEEVEETVEAGEAEEEEAIEEAEEPEDRY